jgi:hypothetical protein
MTAEQRTELRQAIQLLTASQGVLDNLANELRKQLHADLLAPLEWAAIREGNESIDRVVECLEVYLD